LIVAKTKRTSITQIDLLGVGISLTVERVFIGIFSAKRLSIDRHEWWNIITDKRVLSDILT
jgi:hypothetical protein